MRCNLSKIRQALTFLIFCGYNFLSGVEYAVVIPTLWNYLARYGASHSFYGLTLSIFSVARLLFGPIFGYWYDKTHALKFITCFSLLFEIGGNCLYSMGFSSYSILAARFINGIGASAGAILISELSWTIPKENQTRMFSLFFSCFQLGLLIGPGFNFFLQYLHFYIGPFLIDALSVPGAVMVCLWAVLLLAFLIVVKSTPHPFSSIPEPIDSHNLTRAKHISEASPLINEEKPLTISRSFQNELFSSRSRSVSELSRHGIQVYFSWKTLARTLFREEVILLLTLTFVTMFNQTCIETFIVPWTEKYLYWDEGYLSIFYITCACEALISYLFVSILSQYIGDRWLLVIGVVGNTLAYILLLVLLPAIQPARMGTHEGNLNLLKVFGVSTSVIIFLPFHFVGGSSLFSKLVPHEVQGVSQGIRRSFLCFGAIMGPLWAGANVQRPLMMGIVLEAIFLVVLSMAFLSWKKMKPKN